MADAAASDRVRVLSFNVNGLAAVLKRLGHPNITALLADVGKSADIVCFQETKLRRQELAAASHQLATAEGWDSVFCCADSSRGYSGTATFFRTARACPFSAEMGFSGTLNGSSSGGGVGGSTGEGEAHLELLSGGEFSFSIEELRSLDSEGRVVITDHGAFILYNIYAPAITAADPEQAQQRRDFKARFYQALQRRWEAQLAAGRAVVAVGDFNIAPAPIDHPDPLPEAEFYSGHHSRRWLRGLLQGGASSGGGGGENDNGDGESVAAEGAHMPPFVDCFRAFSPTRRSAFTQWSTYTGARANNYGSRIDLTLAAGLKIGPYPPSNHHRPQQQQPTGNSNDSKPEAAATAWVSAADIQPDVAGSDHCPVWVEISTRGAFPCAAAVPRCASSLSISAGKQTKLLIWLSGGGGGATGAPSGAGAASSGGPEKREEASAEVLLSTLERKDVISSSFGKFASAAGVSSGGPSGSPAKAGERKKETASGAFFALSGGARKAGSNGKPGSNDASGLPGKQASLKRFFKEKSAQHNSAAAAEKSQHPAAAAAEQEERGSEDAGPASESQGLIEAELAAAAAKREVELAESKERWRQIQQRMQVPRCKHGESAALKRVNKAGENHGRHFYACARAAGKGPEAQCGFFQWVKDAPRPASSGKASNSGGAGGAFMAKRTKLQK